MLMPSIFRENLFDDWFDFPDFRDLDRTERKLYGRHADRLMKTDVHEHEDHYEVDIDLPGFAKDELTIELKDGYLTVSAAERYAGAMQRSFYVGEELTEEDIKASFKHGVLSLNIPKKEAKAVPEKKTIMIEG